ncbi:hypothetical protein X975_23518, partial [Stegodyphus mimosarum]
RSVRFYFNMPRDKAAEQLNDFKESQKELKLNRKYAQ